MTVICKVSVRDVRSFGTEILVKSDCIAENEVMAMYNLDDEDKLFTKASPSGSADFVVDKVIEQDLPRSADRWQRKMYLVFVKQDDKPTFETAIAFAPVRVESMTDFGGTSKQVEISTFYGNNAPGAAHLASNPRFMKKFSHRIMIDNPGAFNQLSPGSAVWWVGIYDATRWTMAEALADAHA